MDHLGGELKDSHGKLLCLTVAPKKKYWITARSQSKEKRRRVVERGCAGRVRAIVRYTHHMVSTSIKACSSLFSGEFRATSRRASSPGSEKVSGTPFDQRHCLCPVCVLPPENQRCSAKNRTRCLLSPNLRYFLACSRHLLTALHSIPSLLSIPCPTKPMPANIDTIHIVQ